MVHPASQLASKPSTAKWAIRILSATPKLGLPVLVLSFFPLACPFMLYDHNSRDVWKHESTTHLARWIPWIERIYSCFSRIIGQQLVYVEYSRNARCHRSSRTTEPQRDVVDIRSVDCHQGHFLKYAMHHEFMTARFILRHQLSLINAELNDGGLTNTSSESVR